jgi:uncharacterized membrane protein YbhN (UPF0104 family)
LTSLVATVLETFARVDPALVAVALAFHLANMGLRSLAWRNVLRAAYPDRSVPFAGVAGAYLAGVAINSFTPARGGDVAKIALVRTRIHGSSVATIAASMSVVSLLDAVIGATVIGLLAATGSLPAPPGLPSPPAAPALLAAHPGVAIAVAAALALAAVLLARRCSARRADLGRKLKLGGAILGTPRRYATDVAALQLASWSSRVAAAFFLLGAFGVPATLPAAATVVVVGGLATVVPTPGGAGAQQALLAYVLQTTATTATVVSFSVGMQAAVTLVNVSIGVAAAMLMLRTFRPARMLRTHVRALRAETAM